MDSIGTTLDNLQDAGVAEVMVEQEVVGSLIKQDNSKENLLQNIDINVYEYISQHIIPEREGVMVLDANSSTDFDQYDFSKITGLINLRQINNSRFINRFLIKVNRSLPDAGIFIGCVETVRYKKRKHFEKGKNFLKLLTWLFIFIIHRVSPKTKYLQKIYFGLTKGRYRWVTMAEALGRIVSCGFEIIEYKEVNGKLYFVVMKTAEPDFSKKPSFGPLFPMNRVGKGGEMIKVYKFRTMHPYAEYLQGFVVKLNGYNEVGKPANDFRLAGWGQIFRKYWLDELPQLYNLLKGDLGVVGVRPLSKTRFNELPKEVQEMRVKFKPGCIPPYVALNMPDSDGNIEAERIYMEERLKNGFRTDIKYFFLAVYNILTGKITSS
ncbi:sugar transferase [Labilibacter marinus]|uniref:sugar transferase n=1 Tax=Labilibacter marinus TaxID=1477105 RepID=UPI00082CCF41|nr:sugar transferase [Labilibacter marinus]